MKVGVLNRLKLKGDLLLLGDVPMILTTRDFIAKIQKVAEEILGVNGAKTLMYRAGFEGGRFFAEEQMKIFGVGKEEILKKYLEIASTRGWGRFEIVSANEEVVIRIHHSYGEEYGEVGRDVCYIWQGALAGIVHTSIGARVKGEEVKCVGKGDPYCEIRITKMK